MKIFASLTITAALTFAYIPTADACGDKGKTAQADSKNKNKNKDKDKKSGPKTVSNDKKTDTKTTDTKTADTKAAKKASKEDEIKFAKVTVADLQKKLTTKKLKNKVFPVDVNGKDTREKYGVIPGAILLTSSKDFKISELPKDKDSELVFYCSNTRCGASKRAATTASKEGFKNISVLPVGIKGWSEEGMKTEKTPRS